MRRDISWLRFVMQTIIDDIEDGGDGSVATLFVEDLRGVVSLLDAAASREPGAWRSSLTGAITPFEPPQGAEDEWRPMFESPVA